MNLLSWKCKHRVLFNIRVFNAGVKKDLEISNKHPGGAMDVVSEL